MGVEEECSACRMEPIPNLRDNGFTDGRDTDPGRQSVEWQTKLWKEVSTEVLVWLTQQRHGC